MEKLHVERTVEPAHLFCIWSAWNVYRGRAERARLRSKFIFNWLPLVWFSSFLLLRYYWWVRVVVLLAGPHIILHRALSCCCSIMILWARKWYGQVPESFQQSCNHLDDNHPRWWDVLSNDLWLPRTRESFCDAIKTIVFFCFLLLLARALNTIGLLE